MKILAKARIGNTQQDSVARTGSIGINKNIIMLVAKFKKTMMQILPML